MRSFNVRRSVTSKILITLVIGKWHLGDSPEVMPTAQGFDHYFGIPYSNDMALDKGWRNIPDHLDKIWAEKKWDLYKNDIYHDLESIESPVNQVTITERYTEEAVKFIRTNKDKSFFLYMPHAMVHVPLFVQMIVMWMTQSRRTSWR